MASQQKEGENVMEILEQAQLVNHDGKPVKLMEKNPEIIGLYFSAHWCPPCKGFTPVLSKFYQNAKGKKIEIVFVSSDRDEGSFDGYFKEMPWIALSFSERTTKDKLAKKYGISGIPTLVILDKEGNELTKDGRSGVMANQDGKIPW